MTASSGVCTAYNEVKHTTLFDTIDTVVLTMKNVISDPHHSS